MTRQPERTKYRLRIESILKSPPKAEHELIGEMQTQAHWAKYVCVLVSGYLEQSVKEILLAHSAGKSAPRVSRYVERSWPISRNMSCANILEILNHFDEDWASKFDKWLKDEEERKGAINNLVSWRNNIAHGNEANTTGVTINSVTRSFKHACALVDLLDDLATLE